MQKEKTGLEAVWVLRCEIRASSPVREWLLQDRVNNTCEMWRFDVGAVEKWGKGWRVAGGGW